MEPGIKAEAVESKARGSVPLVLTAVLGFVLLLMSNIAGAGDFRWRYALYFVLTFLLAAIALYLYVKGEKPSFDRGFLVTLAVFTGLIILGAFSFFWGESMFEGMQGLLLTGSFFLSFLLGYLLLRRWEELWLFMGLVAAASVSLCIYGLLQYFFFFNDLIEFMGRHGLDYVISDRVNSRFSSPNWFASFLNIAIPITVVLLLLEKRKALKWVWGGAVSLQLTCLYLTQSRGGWAAFILVAAALVLLIPGRAWKRGWKVLAAALVLAVVLSSLCSISDPLATSGSTDAYGEAKPGGWDYSGIDVSSASASVSSRINIFRTALDMFSHNLAGGVGTGNYGLAVQHHQYQSYYATHAGNYLLETGAEGGIIGLALILALTLLVLYRIRAVFRFSPGNDLRVMGVALWASVLGFFAHNLIDTSWYNPLTGVVCWLCAGALFAVTAGGLQLSEEAAGPGESEGDEGADEGASEAALPGRSGAAVALSVIAALAVLMVSGYVLTTLFLSETGKEGGGYESRYGETAIALEDYQDALGYYEAYPEVHRQLGSIYLNLFVKNGRFAEDENAARAAYHIDRSIELEPENSFGHLSKGLLLLNLKQGDAGRASLEEAQRLYPNNPAAFYFEAESYLAEGEYGPAMDKYLEALELFPYYANQSIVPFQERAEDRYFLMSIQRVVQILLMEGKTEEALETVDRYLEDLPDSAWLHFLRATVLKQMEQWEQALRELELVLALDPGLSGVYLEMGRCYKELGDLQKAEEMFRAELEVDPQSKEAQAELRSITEGSTAEND